MIIVKIMIQNQKKERKKTTDANVRKERRKRNKIKKSDADVGNK